MMSSQPPAKLKLFFWLILGALSVFFAEVCAGSDLFPYFHPWGILVVCPLYMLHTLVLATIVFRQSRPQLSSLYIAGAIFGLYEAYITKVIWSPTWGDPMVSVGGIALVEALLLVLFWHPFMAFIIPLMIGESLLTNSREIVNRLPKRLKSILESKTKIGFLLVALAVTFSILHSANSPSPLHSLASGLSTTAFLGVLIAVWRNKTNGMQYDMQTLLPGKVGMVVLFFFLGLLYLGTGIFLRPEAIPGLGPQLLVWLAYASLLLLLITSLRNSRQEAPLEPLNSPVEFSWKQYLVLSLTFTFSSTIVNLAMGILSAYVFMAVFALGSVCGIVMLIRSVMSILSTRRYRRKFGGSRDQALT